MGSNHARVFADLAGVSLVGVADPDPKPRDMVAGALACAAFPDVRELLAVGVDAVTIAAPAHLHQELALYCIKRGVDVLVEKPIAPSVAEGRTIIAAARHAGVSLMVGHVERFNPTVEAIKDAIRAEDILSIAITRVGPFPPRMSNVGVVIDLAVLDIDLIRWFTESEIIEVQPHLSTALADRRPSRGSSAAPVDRPDAILIGRIFTVGGLTLLSRLTGFGRDIVLAAVLGAGPIADAFFVALRLPNHFRAIFAEGAFNAAFVPAYARIQRQDGSDRAKLFGDRVFTLLFASQIILLAVALVFTPTLIELLAPGFRGDPGRFTLAVELTRITFPYLLLVSLVTLYDGILNTFAPFSACASAP